jgi:apolipoprotein N-acyltransferase
LTRTRSGWGAFATGWMSQTIAWLIMVPWVVRVMSHYGGLPYAAGVAIFVAMAAILGLYGGLFAWIVYRLRLGSSFHRWLAVPLAWAAVEYLRTYLLTGFPWNLLVAAIIDYTSFSQFSRVAGPYLVGAMLVFMSSVLAWLLTQRVPAIARVLVVSGTLIVLGVWWASGLVATKLITRPSGIAPTTAALLQPNIPQQMRWDPQNTIRIYEQMIAMTNRAADAGAKVVIWPESTVPLAFTSSDFYKSEIERISAQRNIDIILGSVAEDPQQANRLWNSAYLVTGGNASGRYDKIRLVPFGEYVPLRKMLFFAEKLVHAVGEFSFGTNDRPLRGVLSYGPAICYEIVFPQVTRTQVRNGAEVLVTITNDAWYDGTSAPRQHLNQARIRAIETDRYVLRAATTGISAFIDPAGQVLEALPMNRQGIIYASFQPRKTVTPYVRLGDWFAWVALLVTIIAIVVIRKEFKEARD